MTTSQPAAIVTGGARGIGAAAAKRLSRDGFAVGIIDVCRDIAGIPYGLATSEDLDETVAACGPHAIGTIADVRDRESLSSAVNATVDELGGLDVVVASAGIISNGAPHWEMSEEDWAVNIDVLLTGVWRTASVCVPHMLAQPVPRRGRFIAISSATGLQSQPMISAYSSAKHGVVGLTKSMAKELAAHGITANVICPGSTRTKILQASADLYGVTDLNEFAQHHAINELLEPSEIAHVVAFLASAEASHITGVALPVDAGMVL